MFQTVIQIHEQTSLYNQGSSHLSAQTEGEGGEEEEDSCWAQRPKLPCDLGSCLQNKLCDNVSSRALQELSKAKAASVAERAEAQEELGRVRAQVRLEEVGYGDTSQVFIMLLSISYKQAKSFTQRFDSTQEKEAERG